VLVTKQCIRCVFEIITVVVVIFAVGGGAILKAQERAPCTDLLCIFLLKCSSLYRGVAVRGGGYQVVQLQGVAKWAAK